MAHSPQLCSLRWREYFRRKNEMPLRTMLILDRPWPPRSMVSSERLAGSPPPVLCCTRRVRHGRRMGAKLGPLLRPLILNGNLRRMLSFSFPLLLSSWGGCCNKGSILALRNIADCESGCFASYGTAGRNKTIILSTLRSEYRSWLATRARQDGHYSSGGRTGSATAIVFTLSCGCVRLCRSYSDVRGSWHRTSVK